MNELNQVPDVIMCFAIMGFAFAVFHIPEVIVSIIKAVVFLRNTLIKER